VYNIAEKVGVFKVIVHYHHQNANSMNQRSTTTTDDLILYLYNEQTPLEKAVTEAELEWHEELYEEYEEYKEVLAELDTMKHSPSDSSVKIVLDHARLKKVEDYN